MKILLLAATFITVASAVQAQNTAKTVSAEFLGPGISSINYDMRLKGQDGIGFRAGVGYGLVEGSLTINTTTTNTKIDLFTFPIGVNYLLGKNTIHFFEIGAGFTPVWVKVRKDNTITDNKFLNSYGHLHFGYRKQPKEKGFCFRAGITPIFGKGFFIPLYGSIAFGYKF
jgi:hypothetical protein